MPGVWPNHLGEAWDIYQEGKDMGSGRTGTSQQGKNQELRCGCIQFVIPVGLTSGDGHPTQSASPGNRRSVPEFKSSAHRHYLNTKDWMRSPRGACTRRKGAGHSYHFPRRSPPCPKRCIQAHPTLDFHACALFPLPQRLPLSPVPSNTHSLRISSNQPSEVSLPHYLHCKCQPLCFLKL